MSRPTARNGSTRSCGKRRRRPRFAWTVLWRPRDYADVVARSAGGGGIAVPIVGVIIAVDTGQPSRANSSTNRGANGASGPVNRTLDGSGLLCMDLLLSV